MENFTAILAALQFLLPPLVCALLFALITTTAFKWMGPKSYRDGIDFGLTLRVAMAFSAFAFALGIFVGMTGNLLVTTVLGTVTTTGTAYLAYLYGKDSIAESHKVLLPALISFFFLTPLMIDYVLQLHAIFQNLISAAKSG